MVFTHEQYIINVFLLDNTDYKLSEWPYCNTKPTDCDIQLCQMNNIYIYIYNSYYMSQSVIWRDISEQANYFQGARGE